MEYYMTNRDYRFVPGLGLTRIVVNLELVLETEAQWNDLNDMINNYVRRNTPQVQAVPDPFPLPVPTSVVSPPPTEDESTTVFNTIDID